MNGCIFCKIIKREIPAGIVYEDASVIAIRDINPQAPVHVLLMPKKHIDDILGFGDEDSGLLSAIISAIGIIAEKTGIRQNGFRVISNCGKAAGQSVRHVHFHILGGSLFGERII